MAAGESALGRRGSCEKTEDSLSGKKRAQERPLHQVERALRARFQLWIQNRNETESPISCPTGGMVKIER
jgi:hypothetical protein